MGELGVCACAYGICVHAYVYVCWDECVECVCAIFFLFLEYQGRV